MLIYIVYEALIRSLENLGASNPLLYGASYLTISWIILLGLIVWMSDSIHSLTKYWIFVLIIQWLTIIRLSFQTVNMTMMAIIYSFNIPCLQTTYTYVKKGEPIAKTFDAFAKTVINDGSESLLWLTPIIALLLIFFALQNLIKKLYEHNA